MTEYNEHEWDEETTFGELLRPAMKITDPVEAQSYFDALINFYMRVRGCDEVEAIQVARSNLGYYAGYYNIETQRQVQRLFGAVHPIFGSVGKKPISPEDAFELGYQRGQEANQE